MEQLGQNIGCYGQAGIGHTQNDWNTVINGTISELGQNIGCYVQADIGHIEYDWNTVIYGTIR